MKPFSTFLWRITSSHIISYFLAGIFAYSFLNYQALFETPPFSSFMKPTNSTSSCTGSCITNYQGRYFFNGTLAIQRNISEYELWLAKTLGTFGWIVYTFDNSCCSRFR